MSGEDENAARARWSAVVLAGGAARRLGGVDKPALQVGGRSLLRRAVDAVAGAHQVVAVGPRREIDGVRWTRERPPGAGPVAALAAGLAALDGEPGEIVVVLAADLPGITPSTVDRLRAAVADGPGEGVVLTDAGGRRQWLCGAWRLAALRGVLPADPVDAALHASLSRLEPAGIPALPGEAADVDTPEDLDRARRGR